MSEQKDKISRTGLEIAVIGMSGRFPGAGNIHEFWENLKNGVESIKTFSTEELLEEGLPVELLDNPNYVKAKGSIDDPDKFDAPLFGYTPEEAETMDPQVRLFHQCAWEALEDAGYDPDTYRGAIGVYAGLTPSFLWTAANFIKPGSGSSHFAAGYLNSNSFTTLISYKLNLRGPAMAVQTACSTSLVALHQACRSLLTGDCNIALAGGVTVSIPSKVGYMYQEGMINSPDGHCRAFDAAAKGTVGAEGVGIAVLKRLDAAIAARDTIYAVIKGSAVNNDGSRKVGYTAPGVEGQTAVIKAAVRMAEVKPESYGYVEAHGTGTTLGDPIEIEALKKAFDTDEKNFCAIGSLKTNVGHMDSAAGIGAFIKTVLSIKNRMLPPSLHFKTPNPGIDFDNSPFYVNTQLKEWRSQSLPLRAGVSSFGIGGTNAHVVLEEAPAPPATTPGRPCQLLLLSAHTPTALDTIAHNLAHHLKANPQTNLADVAYTLMKGRKTLKYRKRFVCRDVPETIAALTDPGPENSGSFAANTDKKHIVFMFPGQGAQYVDMGLELYKNEPLFREEADRCFDILKPIMETDIKAILYPGLNPLAGGFGDDDAGDINRTHITQPLIFVFEYALATLLIKWGIKPHSMIGHSIGEYTAAHLSGVLSLEDALRLVAFRGKIMNRVPGGAMLSVPLSESQLTPLLHEDVSLAAVNSTDRCVVSGTHEAIEAFARDLKQKGYQCRPLHTSHAFHSDMMESVLEEFEKNVAGFTLNKPEIPFISNLTGTWITPEQAADPAYWTAHLRNTVHFARGVETLLKKKNPIFIEVGPGKTLGTFVRGFALRNPAFPVLNLVRHPNEDVSDHSFLLTKLGDLSLHHKTIDPGGFYSAEKRQRIPLPTYPFEGRRYWKMAKLLKSAAGLSPEKLLSGGADIAPDNDTDETLHTPPDTSTFDSRPHMSTAYVAPQNDTEKKLADIWREFFGIKEVGVHDDFFELGGDSLKAMNLTALLWKKFNVEVSLKTFFTISNIHKLARYIRETEESTYSGIMPVEKKEYYPIADAQSRLYIMQQMNTSGISYNMNQAVLIEGDIQKEKFEQAMKKLIAMHESLRTSFREIDSKPVQVIHPGVDFHIECYETEEGTQNNVETIRDNFIRPFDLSCAPLMRAGLIKTGPKRHILIVDMHHIITDAVSVTIFIRDFVTLYSGKELPTPKLQYKEISQWMNSMKKRNVLKKQQDFWLGEFSGEIPVLNLPTDYPRPDVFDFKGDELDVTIPPETCIKLKTLARETGSTLNMILLSIYYILLSKYSRQQDIVVGTTIAGRKHTAMQNVIGMFVNMLPLRMRLLEDETYIDFLGKVKEKVLAAMDNQDFQFDELVNLLGVKRDSGRNPLFNLVFNMVNIGTASDRANTDEKSEKKETEKSAEGAQTPLKVESYQYKDYATVFDLIFAVSEIEDSLLISVKYSTQLFKHATIEKISQRYMDILNQVMETKQTKLEDIKLSHHLLSADSNQQKYAEDEFDF